MVLAGVPGDFKPHSGRAAGMAWLKAKGWTDDSIMDRANLRSKYIYRRHYKRGARPVATLVHPTAEPSSPACQQRKVLVLANHRSGQGGPARHRSRLVMIWYCHRFSGEAWTAGPPGPRDQGPPGRGWRGTGTKFRGTKIARDYWSCQAEGPSTKFR